MNPSLELFEIRKSFGDFVAVDGISLAVPPGTIFGVLGPNGAGKTTTIRMIMDIIAPDSGQVHLFGRRRERSDLHRIGYLPEERGLYRKMKIAEQLLYLAELRGVARSDAKARIERWLERVELSEWADKKVEELSKGMQQKIQLIGTVLHEPELLILDEPFSGLDPINQQLFKEMIADYKERGKTILFSTHVMEQAEKLCDHIGLVSRGRLVLSGELAALKRQMGGNSYRVLTDAPADAFSGVAGVEQAVETQGTVKLLLAPEADPANVLRDLVGRAPVRGFENDEPELQEIFVKAVRDAA